MAGGPPRTPAAPGPDPYAALREEIDRIDGELLALLNRRARAALEIGRAKRARNEPIHVPEREQAVLERLLGENAGPLDPAAVSDIFATIMRHIRALEENADGT